MHSRASSCLPVPGRQFHSFLRKFKIAGNGHPDRFGASHEFQIGRQACLADRRRDPGHVQPMHAIQGRVEIVFARGRQAEGAESRGRTARSSHVGSRRLRRSTAPSALVSPKDVIRFDAQSAQRGDQRARDRRVAAGPSGNATGLPNIASDAETFASPPPQVTCTRPGNDCAPAQVGLPAQPRHDFAECQKHAAFSPDATCWSDRPRRRRPIKPSRADGKFRGTRVRLAINAADPVADRDPLNQLVGRQRTDSVASRIVQEILAAGRAARVRAVNVPRNVDAHRQFASSAGRACANLRFHKLVVAEDAAAFPVCLAEDQRPLADHVPGDLAAQDRCHFAPAPASLGPRRAATAPRRPAATIR